MFLGFYCLCACYLHVSCAAFGVINRDILSSTVSSGFAFLSHYAAKAPCELVLIKFGVTVVLRTPPIFATGSRISILREIGNSPLPIGSRRHRCRGADCNKREKFECVGNGVRCGCRIRCQWGGTELDRLGTQV